MEPDDPPLSIALLAISPSCLALLLLSFASIPSPINLLTAVSTAAAFTMGTVSILEPFGIQSLPSFRITQTNGCPDDSSPSAISLNCSTEKRLILPKHMYTTEPLGLLSSHFKHSLKDAGYTPPLVDLSITSLLHRETGPTFHTLPTLWRWWSAYLDSSS
ncbi:hypothetical protein IEQ34_006538 [Dendrobium chrysotoxum]|uniref:Uncharacterized protein n=1 Tax=Dendrobium chrysotoxum TaxID=161865 RepID=A0AAV7H494_DENCH|nr:hypothetical protein IEQ34_006538 [Dendrobium chrysotoxum]